MRLQSKKQKACVKEGSGPLLGFGCWSELAAGMLAVCRLETQHPVLNLPSCVRLVEFVFQWLKLHLNMGVPHLEVAEREKCSRSIISIHKMSKIGLKYGLIGTTAAACMKTLINSNLRGFASSSEAHHHQIQTRALSCKTATWQPAERGRADEHCGSVDHRCRGNLSRPG